MHANLLAQSDRQSGADLRARGVVVGTISGATVEEVEQIDPKKKGKQLKGVITFAEPGVKSWLVNKTNVEILKVVFGDGRCGKQGSERDHADGKCYETAHWVGHKIALGATPQRVGGDEVDGIIVVGCDSLPGPLAVTVKLRNKAPRAYTVKPFSKSTTAPRERQPGEDG